MRLGAHDTLGAIRSAEDAAAVRARLPGGQGARYVIEAVGRPEAWQAAMLLAAPGGEVTLYGGCAPGSSLALDAARLHYDELRVQGSYHHTPGTVREALDVLARDARYESLIAGAITLDQVPETLRGGSGDKYQVSL